MAMIVRAFPLKKGCTRADLEVFIRELEERKQEVARWHDDHSIHHESWYLQETDAGPWVIAINEGSEVQQNAQRFGAKDSGFEAWFKLRVRELTGVDLNTTPLGPPTTPVYEWSQDEVTRLKFEPFRG
jgi:hypothetical protein